MTGISVDVAMRGTAGVGGSVIASRCRAARCISVVEQRNQKEIFSCTTSFGRMRCSVREGYISLVSATGR